jgi:hypothetical protein
LRWNRVQSVATLQQQQQQHPASERASRLWTWRKREECCRCVSVWVWVCVWWGGAERASGDTVWSGWRGSIVSSRVTSHFSAPPPLPGARPPAHTQMLKRAKLIEFISFIVLNFCI